MSICILCDNVTEDELLCNDCIYKREMTRRMILDNFYVNRDSLYESKNLVNSKTLLAVYYRGSSMYKLYCIGLHLTIERIRVGEVDMILDTGVEIRDVTEDVELYGIIINNLEVRVW